MEREQEFPGDAGTAGTTPVDAGNAPRKPRGRPITPETARAYQMSSTQAKRARKEARMKMLAALTHRLDLGEELYKAMAQKDSEYLQMIEKATALVGLQWSQSDEGREQRLHVDTKADVNAKVSAPSLSITFSDAKPKEQ